MSLFSSISLVTSPVSGCEIEVSWLPDTVSDERAGKRDATSTIYIYESVMNVCMRIEFPLLIPPPNSIMSLPGGAR